MGGTGVIDNFLGVFTQYIDSGFGLVQGDRSEEHTSELQSLV